MDNQNKNINLISSIKKIIDTIYKTIQKFIGTSMHVYAANASYFMIIAAIPTIMLMFSAFSLIPQGSIDTFFDNLNVLIPDIPYIKETIDNLMNIAKGLASPSLISLNVLAALIATSGVLHSLSFAIKKTHGFNNRFNFLKLRLLSLFNVLLFLAIMILMIIALLLGDSILFVLKKYLPYAYDIVKIILSYKYPVAFIGIMLFFLSFYTTSTDFKRPIKANIYGSVIATLLWMLTSIGFSIWFNFFPMNANIYGPLISVVIIMLWLWVVFMIILAGATFNEILYPQVYYNLKEIKEKSDKINNKKEE